MSILPVVFCQSVWSRLYFASAYRACSGQNTGGQSTWWQSTSCNIQWAYYKLAKYDCPNLGRQNTSWAIRLAGKLRLTKNSEWYLSHRASDALSIGCTKRLGSSICGILISTDTLDVQDGKLVQLLLHWFASYQQPFEGCLKAVWRFLVTVWTFGVAVWRLSEDLRKHSEVFG